MLICHLYIYFGKGSVKVFAPFLNWVIFLWLIFNMSLYKLLGFECLSTETIILNLPSSWEVLSGLSSTQGISSPCFCVALNQKGCGFREWKEMGNLSRVKRDEVLLFFITLCFPLDDVCYIHN